MMNMLCIAMIALTLAGNAVCETPSPHLQIVVNAELGENVTLPCRQVSSENNGFSFGGVRVKWTKVANDGDLVEDVMSSMGFHQRRYGSFENRVYLQNRDNEDASLIITDVSVDDMGTYRCEIINGEDDTVQDVILEVENGVMNGVVFPYSPPIGRYNLDYERAWKTCLNLGAEIASYEQLHEAWKGGLDWCNAGWLLDGTVQYPITKPREPCGGSNSKPGLRNYGRRDKKNSRFDVFCYVSELKGHFYWLIQPERLTFDEAVQACKDDGGEIARVGHMYAAWKLEGYDRCDAGWLADGSVRYPISRPRKHCSPDEAAVRFVGYPDKSMKSYGVYCFKEEDE